MIYRCWILSAMFSISSFPFMIIVIDGLCKSYGSCGVSHDCCTGIRAFLQISLWRDTAASKSVRTAIRLFPHTVNQLNNANATKHRNTKIYDRWRSNAVQGIKIRIKIYHQLHPTLSFLRIQLYLLFIFLKKMVYV